MVARTGSIVIPAHNEEAVISRTLGPLSRLARAGVDVVVVANGCSDDTAERARSVDHIRVLEAPEPSKASALNRADAATSTWPRLYLDADIAITAEAVDQVFAVLAQPGVLGARPAFFYETQGADFAVQAYYRARSRIPAMHEHLWGAGAYALNQEGHERLGSFPVLVADDLYVDQLFHRSEVAIVATSPVPVRVPRSSRVLLRTLTRVQRGKREVARHHAIDRTGSVRALLSGVRGPASLRDALIYAAFSAASRLLALRGTRTWQRDDTSRASDSTDRPRLVGQGAAATTASSVPVDQVVLTRFNVPSEGVESLIRAREGWLRRRVDLFETYTVPSMERQQAVFTWLIYFDPQSPGWLRDWLRPFADRGLFVPIFREVVSDEDLVGDIRRHVPRRSDILITTNLDNDDGLAADFLTQVRQATAADLPNVVYLSRGLILRGNGVYLRDDRHNAFCSVRERWDRPLTCWADWHNRLPQLMPVVEVAAEPAWLQVVHDTNVSNRVNGVRVPPDRYRARFEPLLDAVTSPDPWSLALDRLLSRPMRFVRESCWSVLKHAVILLVGADGPDRLKEILHRRRAGRDARHLVEEDTAVHGPEGLVGSESASKIKSGSEAM